MILIQYSKGSYVTYQNQVFMTTLPADINQSPYAKKKNWVLIIPAKTYPPYNVTWDEKKVKNGGYQAGDIVIKNGQLQLFSVVNGKKGKWVDFTGELPNSKTIPNYWSRYTKYRIGDYINYSGNWYVNIGNIGPSSQNPYARPYNWRIVQKNDQPFGNYINNIVYYKGIQIRYNGQTFVNIKQSRGESPSSAQNSWRILLPSSSATYFISSVRYYQNDQIQYNGKTYKAIVPYNTATNPGDTPQSAPSKWQEV